ncbi:NUDIX domain-containing protein [Lentzea aerocolonigenes]|uniref:NUDIX domain-containing protein n=1 Tax=Lentzea aerocolonigenes TaxID=68170 RepID=UPI00068C9DB8|nr:NUDIX hydrolase [Lentzea aerocolonigenes]MCP2244253.1 8-oxo-dGTP pyrophosphatase MutT, NUDIX family [Lentzea aerocolonigenes]
MNFQFAQKAVVIQDGALLMVRKSAEDPHNPNRWELPGGRMKSHESIDEHLCREIWEEVGLKVAPGRPLSIWSWTMNGGSGAVTVVAVARACDVLDGTITEDNRDEDDYLAESEWVPLDAVLGRDVIPSQEHVLREIVAASLLGASR